ncbi:prolyl oligopeptidase [Gorgonomyces haynaldii]|nr:prolyl oligopeptidase [Gorgonomyces haynaldii]
MSLRERTLSAASIKEFPAVSIDSITPIRKSQVLLEQQQKEFWNSVNIDQMVSNIEQDKSNLLKCLPDILNLFEHACLEDPQQCDTIWTAFKPLLLQLNKQVPQTNERPHSPKCKPKHVKTVNVHGEEWTDDYVWLKDREDPSVLNYIQQENEYTRQMMAPTKPLQKLLYKEFVSRLDQDEQSAPVTLQTDGWSYYSRRVAGEEYRRHCRVKNNQEQVILDENLIANSPEFKEASYFRVGFLKISPDCRLLAYGIDSNGQERYTTFFLDLETLELLPDRIQGVYEDFEFSQDGSCVYYTLLDDTERAYQLKRHVIGQDVKQDTVLFHETDEMYFLTVTKSSDGKYILFKSSAQVTSETHYISSSGSDCQPHLIFPRREGIHYTVDHHEGHFFVLSNEEGKNNWIYRIPGPELLQMSSWEEWIAKRETVIEHRDFVLVEEFQFRKNHMIVMERSNCMQNMRIVDFTDDPSDFSQYHYVSFSESVYSIWLGSPSDSVTSLTQRQFDTHIVRFNYTSFIQPKQVIDYDMNTRTKTVVHEERLPVPYDQKMYVSKRLFATGHDGTAVPLSIVYRRDLLGMNMPNPQFNPLLLHAYGAYGMCLNTTFSTSRLSLLDRGFVFAIAHVRGGSDMGNAWYEEGKLGKKSNTFFDFCSVAEFLIKEGFTTPEKLAIYGRSAGGLLICSVIHMKPHLFRAALTEVPFVDVINTMFDASIPWTAFEWEEWGNPQDPSIYQVMKSYCPYTNLSGEQLAKNEYPHLLVIGGMNDPRVAFFEPLRLVAKMRNERSRLRQKIYGSREALKDDRLVLLKIDDAGHGGNSGQYSYLEDLAFEYAYLITTLQAPNKCISNDAITPQLVGIMSPTEDILTSSHRKKRYSKDEESLFHNKERGKGKLWRLFNNIF